MTENSSGNYYDIVELLERFKDGVYDAVTKNVGEFEDSEYKSTRKIILGHPALGALVPDWLRRATTLQELRSEVSRLAGDEPGKWQRRREVVGLPLNQMLDALQGSEMPAGLNLERLERLGGGGFGEVYRYRHKLIEVDFAVKILNPAFAAEGDRSLDRFLLESRILFRLNHPNIVRIYDVGLMGRRPFIRMELVEGETLNSRLAASGSLAEEDANYITLQVARALSHAHGTGVLHRDVKPSNIMVSPDGRVVLLDFGLGVFVEGDIISRITKTGEAAAGGRYTAPELEVNPKLLDPKTDIFSLGAVWFTMLCSQPPAGVKVETMLRGVPSISDGVVKLVLKCLAPLAAERPTANDIIHELEKLRPAPSRMPAVRHIEEEPEEETEGEWAAFWRDTV
jgi:eukaryotic-like serine/threonine-protein kinase